MVGVPIQNILFTVFQSICQVFLLCLAGFTLSFNGIVNKSTSKALNHINISLFTPALLFSKVAYFLSPAKLRQLWVIPIFFVVVTGLSGLVAHGLGRACRLKRSQINFATAAAMFMNSNSLPVALMQSLASTVPLLKWGPDDTLDAMFSRSLTYLVVFSTLGMILRWSYGIRLLSQADEPSTLAPPTYRDADEQPTLVQVTVDAPKTQLVDYETETDDWNNSLHPRLPHPHFPRARRHTYPHHLHSHLPAVPTSLGDQSESEDTDELDTTEAESEDTIALPSEASDAGFYTEAEDTTHTPPPHPSSSTSDPDTHTTPRWGQQKPSFFSRLFSILSNLSPPLVGSLLALFCVLVPPIQQILNSTNMIPFKGALDNAGSCSVPLTLIVLGGWFWDGETKPKSKTGHEDGAEVKDVQRQVKTKGKGVEKRHHKNIPPILVVTERQHPLPHTVLHQKHHVTPHSRDSSSGSLTSLIGSFGDVLMARLHPRSARRAKRRAKGIIPQNQNDVEPGHTEGEQESAENTLGRVSRPRSQSQSWTEPQEGLSPNSAAPASNPPGETITIVVAILARMIIVPFVTIPIMVLVSRFGWGGDVFQDPVFIVSSMLLVSSPPALTLAQISQRAKPRSAASADPDAFSPFERLLSRTVFWAYLVLTPPVTIVSVMVGLLLIGA